MAPETVVAEVVWKSFCQLPWHAFMDSWVHTVLVCSYSLLCACRIPEYEPWNLLKSFAASYIILWQSFAWCTRFWNSLALIVMLPRFFASCLTSLQSKTANGTSWNHSASLRWYRTWFNHHATWKQIRCGHRPLVDTSSPPLAPSRHRLQGPESQGDY